MAVLLPANYTEVFEVTGGISGINGAGVPLISLGSENITSNNYSVNNISFTYPELDSGYEGLLFTLEGGDFLAFQGLGDVKAVSTNGNVETGGYSADLLIAKSDFSNTIIGLFDVSITTNIISGIGSFTGVFYSEGAEAVSLFGVGTQNVSAPWPLFLILIGLLIIPFIKRKNPPQESGFMPA